MPVPDRGPAWPAEDAGWWDGFFADRARAVPFFTARPDENLAEWLSEGLIAPGRVLELGCGNGRNAIFLARLGCDVTAVDFSERALAWARESARQAGVRPEFRRCSVFDAQVPAGSCDLVYDCGCFHHLPPHRRPDYVRLVDRALKPGGGYGLVCFRPEGGSGYTDQEVYQRGSLGGGLGYPAGRLRALWDQPPFSVRVLRQMRKADAGGTCFGEDFLWVLLATKQAVA